MPVMTRSAAQKIVTLEMSGPMTRSKASFMAKYSEEEMDAANTLLNLRVTLRGEQREVYEASEQRQRPRRSCANY